MKTEENYFEGKYNKKIFYRKWLPEGSRKATLMIAHGLNEHSERYINVANKVVPEKIAVYAVDHIGQGRSEGMKAYIKDFTDYTDNLKQFFDEFVKKESENKPVLLLGHSMGSIIAMNYILLHPEGIKALVLSGTGAKVGGISNFMAGLLKAVATVFPKMYFDSPQPLDDVLSRDMEVTRKYKEDPMCGGKLTLSLAKAMNNSLKLAYMNAQNIKLPTLVQCGAKDVIFDGKKELFDKIGSKDKELKIYDGLLHEVYNELKEDREIVLNDLLVWLNNHI